MAHSAMARAGVGQRRTSVRRTGNLLSPAVCSQVPWISTATGMKGTSTCPPCPVAPHFTPSTPQRCGSDTFAVVDMTDEVSAGNLIDTAGKASRGGVGGSCKIQRSNLVCLNLSTGLWGRKPTVGPARADVNGQSHALLCGVAWARHSAPQRIASECC